VLFACMCVARLTVRGQVTGEVLLRVEMQGGRTDGSEPPPYSIQVSPPRLSWHASDLKNEVIALLDFYGCIQHNPEVKHF
jgi:hypothetical protein